MARQLFTRPFLCRTCLPPTLCSYQGLFSQFRALTTSSISGNPTTSPTVTTTAASSRFQTLSLLPFLRSQPSHYITIHIHKFPYLVTTGDTLRLPFLLKGTLPGDTLRLTNASVLGSRDYTLKGTPWIDEDLYECRATVIEETSEPMRFKEKTKRRQRRIHTVKSKHRYTVLRIGEIVIKEPMGW